MKDPSTSTPKENKLTSFRQASPRRKKLLERCKLCVILGIIYLFLSILGVGCPLKFLSGIPCPGCGMTRAVYYALQLNFDAAWYYHPLFLLTPLMLFLFLFESYLPSRFPQAIWGAIIVIFLITYCIRVLVIKSEVVDIDIHSGAVLRLLHTIFVGGN